MDQEKNAEKTIGMYAELAKGDKNIDVASLMVNALQQSRRDEVAAKKKRNAYLVSICLPPLGLFVAVRYYFSDKADAKKVALWCVILTAVSLLIAWGVSSLVTSSVPQPPAGQLDQIDQLQNLKVKDLEDLMK